MTDSTCTSSPEVVSAERFRRAADGYLHRGWRGVLPLNGKQLIASGLTGNDGVDADQDTIHKWPDHHPGCNLALRAPEGIIGLDVDQYDGKYGADQLRELEHELGALPATWRSTSRGRRNPSGIRVYRVPAGFRCAGSVTRADGSVADVEVVQRHHRYLTAWPSIHPRSGRRYRWYSPDGKKHTFPPAPGHVPELPEAWAEYLQTAAPQNTQKASSEFGRALLAALPTGEPSRDMQALLDSARTRLGTVDGTADGARYEIIRDASIRMIRAGYQGQSGAASALDALGSRYAEVMGRSQSRHLTENEANREFQKVVHGGAELVAGDEDFHPLPEGARFPQLNVDPELEEAVNRALAEGFVGSYRLPSNSDGDSDSEAQNLSWAPVDLGALLDGDGPPPPTHLPREDGVMLMYSGKPHSVHGESESGKSWFVQCETARVLLSGGAALYVDFESDGRDVAGRLLLLGVPRDLVADPQSFVYLRPETTFSSESEAAAFEALLSRSFSFAVLDGVTDSMGIFGYSTKDNDEVAAWQRKLPRAIARRTGAAVACVDHVSKDPDTRGRFAIGGQHKLAGLDGAAYIVEMEKPFGVGMAGVASVRLGKDRPGQVRPHGGRWRKGDRTQHVADFHLDSTDPARTTWRIAVPQSAGASSEIDNGTSGTRDKADTFRPTWFMEQVSRFWEETDGAEERSYSKTVRAMCEERKAAGKAVHRDHWRTAINLLSGEGYATYECGPRNSQLYTVLKPYRQTEDEQSDKYSPVSAANIGKYRPQSAPGEDAESDVSTVSFQREIVTERTER